MNSLALIEAPATGEELANWEREITGTLESGDGLMIVARGNSIALVLAKLLNAARSTTFGPEALLSVELSYWHLTDDLDSFRIEFQAAQFHGGTEAGFAVVSHLAARAKKNFAAAMARQGITLVGDTGTLPEA